MRVPQAVEGNPFDFRFGNERVVGARQIAVIEPFAIRRGEYRIPINPYGGVCPLESLPITVIG